MEHGSITLIKHGEKLLELLEEEEPFHIEYFLIINQEVAEGKPVYGLEVYSVQERTGYRCEDLCVSRCSPLLECGGAFGDDVARRGDTHNGAGRGL